MITVEHLTKCYGTGSTPAVNDLSFEITGCGVYGFLGPNGAGKSTTMNILTGCLSLSSGKVCVGGYDIYEQPQKAKKLIGYLPEQPPLYLSETPEEYLRFVGEARGLRGKELREQIEAVAAQTGLTQVMGRLISSLSKGYKQRVGIAQALLGNPGLIILDEPTVGLDPIQIIEIRELIRHLGEDHTVIFSSHILSEVQAICEKVLIIAKGRLVAFDTPDNLEHTLAGSGGIRMQVQAAAGDADAVLTAMQADGAEEADAEAITPEAMPEADAVEVGLETAPDIRPAEPEFSWTCQAQEDGSTLVEISTQLPDVRALCIRLFFAFAEAGLPIFEMTFSRASLEDVFLELTEEAGKATASTAATTSAPSTPDATTATQLPPEADLPDNASQESEVTL